MSHSGYRAKRQAAEEESFAIKGDTWGNDIGNCTSDDAYLSVYFETIWVWVE